MKYLAVLSSLPSVLTLLVGMSVPIAAQAADASPNACVSCHVVGPDKVDHRISTMLKAWTGGKVDADLLAKTRAAMPTGVMAKGNHPSADDALEDIPGACLDCHAPDSKKAPPFARLMHLVHLTGAKNAFVTTYKGDRNACHKLNAKNGEWSMPGGAEQ
jgi:cytochrome c551/c552